MSKLKPQLFFPLLLLAASLACSAVGKYLPPPVTILAAPAESASWDAAGLQKASDIIGERLKEKAAGKYAVKITKNNQISVELYDSVDLDVAQKLITEPGVILFIDSLDAYSLGDEVKIDDKTKVVLTQVNIHSAEASALDASDQYQIAFTLNPDGTKKLAQYTSENVGHFLAILRDGRVVSCPRVTGEITGGEGIISGTFQEAEDFAFLLTHPPLPFPLAVVKVNK